MPTEPPAGAGPDGAPASEAAATTATEVTAGSTTAKVEAPAGSTATAAAAPLPVAKAKSSKPGGDADRSAGGFGAILRKRWRGWLRAIHRDVGYLAVGLTFIYALSGLAINHIQDWDPNFTSFSRETKIAPIPSDVSDEEAIARVRQALKLGTPRDTYRAGDELHLTYDGREVVVYGDSGEVHDQGQSPRFFLRAANWLHYNRGKRAWTYIADAYAILLLYLAVSGLFMIKGKLGLRWRGTALVTLGAAVPIAYVVLSGGPGGNTKKTADATTVAPPSSDESGARDASPPPADPSDAPDGERMMPRPPKAPPAAAPSDAPDGERMMPRPPKAP